MKAVQVFPMLQMHWHYAWVQLTCSEGIKAPAKTGGVLCLWARRNRIRMADLHDFRKGLMKGIIT